MDRRPTENRTMVLPLILAAVWLGLSALVFMALAPSSAARRTTCRSAGGPTGAACLGDRRRARTGSMASATARRAAARHRVHRIGR